MDKDRSDSLAADKELLKDGIGNKRQRGSAEHEEVTSSDISGGGNRPKFKASPDSSSSGGDNTYGSSDLEFITALNQEFFVAVNEVWDEEVGKNVIRLGIAYIRPRTRFGKTQGDHVTAYIAYLHMLITAVEGESIQESASIIANAAKAILPDKAGIFNELLTGLKPTMDKIVSKNNRRELIKHLKDKGDSLEEVEKINEALKRDKRAVFMDVTRQIAEKFLKEVNLDEEVAFARVGESDPAAGEREKKAIHTLKVINEIEGIKGSGNQEPKFDRIYKQCIKTSAPYIRGANIVLGNNIVSKIRSKWEYIKEWDAVTEKREGWEEKREQLVRNKLNDRFAQNFTEHTDEEAVKLIKTQLVNELKQLYDEKMGVEVSSSSASRTTRSSSGSSSTQAQSNPKVELISKCFGDLFDFKYENHKRRGPEVYDLLFKITARHIICIFSAFKECKNLEESTKQQIIGNFLENAVLESQGWKDSEIRLGKQRISLNSELLIEKIKCNADLMGYEMFSKQKLEQKAAKGSEKYIHNVGRNI